MREPQKTSKKSFGSKIAGRLIISVNIINRFFIRRKWLTISVFKNGSLEYASKFLLDLDFQAVGMA